MFVSTHLTWGNEAGELLSSRGLWEKSLLSSSYGISADIESFSSSVYVRDKDWWTWKAEGEEKEGGRE